MSPRGGFKTRGGPINPKEFPVLGWAARISLLCNDAELEEMDGGWTVRGDPTEGALLVLGRKAGINPGEICQGISPGGGDSLFLGSQTHEHLS